jgi:hypothetical protein
MQKVSIFECLDHSSKPIAIRTVEDILNLIKNHPLKERILEANSHPELGGKYNKNKQYTDMVWDMFKKKLVPKERNLYQHVKSTELWVVTWNALFKNKRNKVSIDNLSGYIYGDVDDFQELVDSKKCKDIKEAQEYVWKVLNNKSFKFIKSVWRSNSGEGFGFLMRVDGLTVENFKSTWMSLSHFFESKGVKLDSQTKDITRTNVIAYDPNIFIREDEDIIPYVAVEEEQKKIISFTDVVVPDGLAADMLQFSLDMLYNSKASWADGRLQYGFYFKYFANSNRKGIELSKAMDFLLNKGKEYPALFGYRTPDEVQGVANQVQAYYGHQFGDDGVVIDEDAPIETQVEVKSIYKEYDGVSSQKLEYVWYNLNKKDYEHSKLLAVFSIVIKEAGIPKSNLIEFLGTKLILEDEDYKTIDSIYGNWKYKFGVVKQYTTDAIEEQKKIFEDYCAVNHLKIYKRERYEGNVERKLGEIFQYAKNSNKGLSQDNFFDLLSLYFKTTKSWAITQGDAIEFIKTKYHLTGENRKGEDRNTLRLYDKIVSYLKFMAKEVYNYQPWKFGINTQKCLTEEEVKARYNIEKTYLLEDDEYISDLNLELEDNVIVWGDTGLGKTTWICEKMSGYRLVLVPIIPLLTGIQKKHNAVVYYSDDKDAAKSEGAELIVCTYSSFENLLKHMEKWKKVKIEDYELHFDEFHNNAVASNSSFRGKELNYIVDNMHRFKSRRFYTGTMFPVLHPAYENFNIYRIKAKHTAPKKFMRTKYRSQNKGLLYAINHNLDRENKNIIYLQNKKEEGKLGELVDYLVIKGIDRKNIWCINADTKGSPEFQYLNDNECVADNVQVLICTSVIVEGVNINNPDFTTVHFMSHEGIVNKEQMVNRLRKVFTKVHEPNCMIHLYKRMEDNPTDEKDHVDVVQVQKHLIDMAQKSLNFFSSAYKSNDSASKKVAMKLFTQSIFNRSGLFRIKEGEWDVDYLSIANLAYTEEKNYAYHDIEFTQLMLKEYNWQYVGEQVVLDGVSDSVRNSLDASKQMRQDEIEEAVIRILMDIREDKEKKTIELLDKDNIQYLQSLNFSDEQIELRKKIKRLCYNMSFEDACDLLERWVFEDNRNENTWNKYMRQLTVQVAKKLDIVDKNHDVSTDFAKSLIEYYFKLNQKEKETGRKQLRAIHHLRRVLQERVKKYKELQNVELTDEKVIEIFRRYFSIKECLFNNKLMYHITGLKIENESATQFKKIYEWAEQQVGKDGVFTSDKLTNIVNSIRKELPILSTNPLTSRKAMQLLNEFLEIQRVGRRDSNTHKIVSLTPEAFRNVVIKPLRKTKLGDKHYEDMTTEERKIFNQQIEKDALTFYYSLNKESVLPF